ncbi:hypothetical protein [Paraclostridium sordellii]|uniref:hypothetical protein n=1 Tax=Paraclostridium sordellii TaxID=1505 RepID=UPI0005E780CC|nr:hypothetical protein [Paeniclostridium sordellii]CEO29320.1 Uncharacterised protein [[Clostridium] sordellii] [Paeniclostridium sordellii]
MKNQKYVKMKEEYIYFLKSIISIDIYNLKYNTTMDSVYIPIPEVDFSLKEHYGEKEKEE